MRPSHPPGRGTPPLLRARPLPVVGAGLFALACALAAPGAHAANLVQNGGFELGTEPGAKMTVAPGSTAIQHWTVSGNAIEYVSSEWIAADGVRSVSLNGDNPGSIEQSFATQVDWLYSVRFYLAGDAFPFPVLKHVRVSAAGQSQDYEFDGSHSWPWELGWEARTFTFASNAATATLKFTSLDAGVEGPAIDSVVVAPVGPLDVPAGPMAGFALAPPTPNPAAGPCAISYVLPRAAAIRLTVHDVAGREVAVLFAGTESAGAHSRTWSGDAAPGIYFVRLSGPPGASLVRRVVRIP
jgi:choice-of-anchor C domain-containing protein